METVKFTPDLNAIAQRAKITPFGRADKQKSAEITPTPFIIYNTMQTVQTGDADGAGIYRPSAALQMSMSERIHSEVSVRITNIPTHITQIQLAETLIAKIKEQNPNETILRPFTRLNLVFDKEKHVSRGLAYANCATVEQAKNVARAVREIVMDSCVLSAEILE